MVVGEIVEESIGSAWRQEAWQRFVSIAAAQLQLKVFSDCGHLVSAGNSLMKQKQILPGISAKFDQHAIPYEDQSQSANAARRVSSALSQDFASGGDDPDDIDIAYPPHAIGPTTFRAKPNEYNPRCSHETWENILCILAQWHCTSSASAQGNLLVGLRSSTVYNEENNFNGCESLRLLLTLMTVARMEPVDWRAALETAHGQAFVSLVEGISRKTVGDDVPFQRVCRALARSPLTLDRWESSLTLHSCGQKTEIAMVLPLLSEAVQIKVARKRATFVTFAKSADVSTSLTISMTLASQDAREPHLFISLVCGTARSETIMNINKGQRALVVPGAELVLHFGNPYLSEGDSGCASIALSLLPLRFSFRDLDRRRA